MTAAAHYRSSRLGFVSQVSLASALWLVNVSHSVGGVMNEQTVTAFQAISVLQAVPQ